MWGDRGEAANFVITLSSDSKYTLLCPGGATQPTNNLPHPKLAKRAQLPKLFLGYVGAGVVGTGVTVGEDDVGGKEIVGEEVVGPIVRVGAVVGASEFAFSSLVRHNHGGAGGSMV